MGLLKIYLDFEGLYVFYTYVKTSRYATHGGGGGGVVAGKGMAPSVRHEGKGGGRGRGEYLDPGCEEGAEAALLLKGLQGQGWAVVDGVGHHICQLVFQVVPPGTRQPASLPTTSADVLFSRMQLCTPLLQGIA